VLVLLVTSRARAKEAQKRRSPPRSGVWCESVCGFALDCGVPRRCRLNALSQTRLYACRVAVRCQWVANYREGYEHQELSTGVCLAVAVRMLKDILVKELRGISSLFFPAIPTIRRYGVFLMSRQSVPNIPTKVFPLSRQSVLDVP
jgi:hypothetical protein